ncbi:MAG: ABC transporter permease subunit [Firmicutes bacterium]|nr:ABC transporter permease subunit [Bacillota bacterium]
MKRKKLYGALFAVCAALTAAFIVCAVLFNRGGAEFTSVVAGEKQYARVAVFEGGSLLAGRDNTLAAYDEAGALLWEDASLGNVAVAIELSGDGARAYVASGSRICVYEVSTGKRLAEISGYEGAGGTVAFANITDIALSEDESALAVSHGSSKSRHNLTLLDPAAGETLFHAAVGVTADCVSVADGAVYLGMDSGNVRKYTFDGTLSAQFRLDDDVADLALGADALYAVTSDGAVSKLDRDLSGELAYFDIAGKNELVSPVRIVAAEDGVFVASSEGTLYAFQESLSLRGVQKFGGALPDVAVSGGFLYCPVSGVGLLTGEAAALLASSPLGVVFIVLAALFGTAAIAFAVLLFGRLRGALAKAGKVIWSHRTAYGMLIPVFGLLAVFGFYPMFVAIVRAFTDWNSSTPVINFNGVQNFIMMVSEGYFLTGIRNLVIFLLSYIVKILTVPLLTALMVYSLRSARAKYVYRYLFVLPMVVPSVVSALMWKNIYDPNFGLLNEVLGALHLEQFQTEWLSNPDTAIPALIFVGFPFVDPFSFLIYYSAMMNIPQTTLEAAELDGVTSVRRFFSVILPMIASQIKILIMLGFINQIQDFNLILLLTKGGPGTETYVPGYELYLNATTFGRYGYACALGLVMFAFIFAGTAVLNRVKVNQDVES